MEYVDYDPYIGNLTNLENGTLNMDTMSYYPSWYSIWLYYCLITTVCAIVCLVCALVLVTTWMLLPGWRNLQAYITLNEVISGTIFLIMDLVVSYYHVEGSVFLDSISKFFLYLSYCWTLSASVVTCITVLRLSTANHHEKLITTAFAFILSALIGIVHLFSFQNNYYIPYMCVEMLFFSLYIFLHAGIWLIVISCCSRTLCMCNGCDYVLVLICIGLLCQITCALFEIISDIFFISMIDEPTGEIPHFRQILYCIRLVLPTIFMICNRVTRQQFKRFWQERRVPSNPAIDLSSELLHRQDPS